MDVVAYVAAFYPAVVREESEFLRAKFGEEYRAWEREVPALFPRLTPSRTRATRFAWAQVRLNREWRTALALPLAFGLLYVRRVLFP